MKQTEYLYNNYREDIPAWLLEIDNESRIPWKEFFSSRTVFYPGSWLDPYTVNAFTRSHSAHCFVNVDYNVSKEQLEAELKKPLFSRYTVIYERDITESIFLAMFKQPYSYILDFGLENGSSYDFGDNRNFFSYSPEHLEFFDSIKHFVKFLVLERDAELSDTFGAERFALLFIGGDAFPVFNALYANKNANLFAMLIDDYGYGAQYAYYRRGELLHKIAQKRKVFPELMLTERCNGESMWNGFEFVKEADCNEERCLGSVPRKLYRREV